MRRFLIFALALVAIVPLTGCHHDDDGGENKVISSKGGHPPVEKPAEPGRMRPQLSTAGGGGGTSPK